VFKTETAIAMLKKAAAWTAPVPDILGVSLFLGWLPRRALVGRYRRHFLLGAELFNQSDARRRQ
jgi:hypothetical protein